MSYIQKVRTDIRAAALIAREGVDERANQGIGHAYGALGRRVVELQATGAELPPGLEPELERIHRIEGRI